MTTAAEKTLSAQTKETDMAKVKETDMDMAKVKEQSKAVAQAYETTVAKVASKVHQGVADYEARGRQSGERCGRSTRWKQALHEKLWDRDLQRGDRRRDGHPGVHRRGHRKSGFIAVVYKRSCPKTGSRGPAHRTLSKALSARGGD